MIVVSNSTPLIALDAINALNLLPALFANLHVPEAVYEEVAVAGVGRAGAAAIAAAKWITRHAVADTEGLARLRAEENALGAGECATIILAGELQADLMLLDDRAARMIARRRNLPLLGTVGILLRAKDKRLVPAVKPLLDALLNAGIYLDSTLYQNVLRLAGE